jgi:hypothetical protein
MSNEVKKPPSPCLDVMICENGVMIRPGRWNGDNGTYLASEVYVFNESADFAAHMRRWFLAHHDKKP